MKKESLANNLIIDEQLLFTIMSKLFDIVFLMKVEEGPRFRYVRASDSAMQLASLVESDMGKFIEEVYTKEIAEHLNSQYCKVLEKRDLIVYRDRMNIRNKFRIGESVLLPIPADDGTISYIISFTKDITEIVQTEEQLKEINQLFHSFMEHSHDALVLFDLNGRVMRVNREWERLLGWKEEELIGKEVPTIPKEYSRKYAKRLNQLVAGKCLTSIQMPQVRKDGGIVYVSANITPIFDQNGKVVAGLSLLRDLTEFVSVHERLRQSEELYRKVIEFFPEMVIIHIDGNILYINPAGVEMVNAPRSDMLQGKKLSSLLEKIDEGGEEWHLKTLNGEVRVVQVWGTTIQYKESQAEFLVIRDVTEQKTKDQKIKFMAQYDSLTRLANRNYLTERLNELLFCNIDRQLVILLIDIDRFKFINHLLGHTNGDIVLQRVADRLRRLQSDNVFLSRIGNDEFVVACVFEQEEELEKLLNQLKDHLSKPYYIAGEKLNITASIGISRSSDANLSVDTLISNANKALYYAKMNGTNLLVEYNAEIHDIFAKKIRLESDLQTALEKNQFSLYYQPKINFPNRLISVEALIRWEHPQFGMVSPAEFIPIAEETNLIIEVGKWVIEQASKDLSELHKMGFTDLKMAINFSAKQFNDPNLEKMVLDIIESTNVNPSCFEFEITETTIMKDPTETIETLRRLKERNVTIAIDDFGVSYSSLNYLNRFPIDAVKIDRSFIRDLSNNGKGTDIVEMMISLAHKLNLRVTAEGVETEEQVYHLLDMGCDEMQGYYISKPVPFSNLPEILTHILNMMDKISNNRN